MKRRLTWLTGSEDPTASARAIPLQLFEVSTQPTPPAAHVINVETGADISLQTRIKVSLARTIIRLTSIL